MHSSNDPNQPINGFLQRHPLLESLAFTAAADHVLSEDAIIRPLRNLASFHGRHLNRVFPQNVTSTLRRLRLLSLVAWNAGPYVDDQLFPWSPSSLPNVVEHLIIDDLWPWIWEFGTFALPVAKSLQRILHSFPNLIRLEIGLNIMGTRQFMVRLFVNSSPSVPCGGGPYKPSDEPCFPNRICPDPQ
jgi:hypothetical protein